MLTFFDTHHSIFYAKLDSLVSDIINITIDNYFKTKTYFTMNDIVKFTYKKLSDELDICDSKTKNYINIFLLFYIGCEDILFTADVLEMRFDTNINKYYPFVFLLCKYTMTKCGVNM